MGERREGRRERQHCCSGVLLVVACSSYLMSLLVTESESVAGLHFEVLILGVLLILTRIVFRKI